MGSDVLTFPLLSNLYANYSTLFKRISLAHCQNSPFHFKLKLMQTTLHVGTLDNDSDADVVVDKAMVYFKHLHNDVSLAVL